MADQIELLQTLQALDGELYRLKRAREEQPRELERAREHVAGLESAFKETQNQFRALQMEQKEREGELAAREGNVKKLQGQLLQLKTNKEYTTMQHEIDTLKADSSLLEEVIIKVLDRIDEASQARAAEQERMAQAQRNLEQEQTRVQREVAEIEGKMTQLNRQRQEFVPKVPQQSLTTYERILTIHEELAMVPVVAESCGGCDRRLPPQVVNRVYLKAELVTCENCNRILYKKDEY